MHFDSRKTCSSVNFVNFKIVLLMVIGEEAEGDIEIAEIVAQQTLAAHGSLLSKGLALSNPPTVSHALDGVLPFR